MARVDKEEFNTKALYRIHTETELIQYNQIYHNIPNVDNGVELEQGSWTETVRKENGHGLQHSEVSGTTLPEGSVRVDNDELLSAVCPFR